ncbi:sugar phosphate isomerase/epimerase and 4-hydroxyphenylpyruvate domain-containing protein [Actinoplanes sp. NBRC 101535]|uniref:bifunctional sugar phosphate isomerase/epimerase/4-hydroxyphenylpyruvate dioxygenase family protein n=1 Tax=Actinoplanes sp. NBRC 101535 TaxID=3032196 RepID=UPI0024A5B45E|nr:sugar phosphate isomerase/epimerase and 4-hydroxyphenylpyruvate domain-containing protein [Actinoplanes sp. NBRC 101535]GLY05549.1 4-hydroxyphenylpyruvate dioxygenase [Actinoplanes sp. NBRC 101535]
MRRSIATVCMSGTLDDKLAAAAAAGFDGIELFENDLVVSPLSPAAVRARCADLGLSIDLYQPFRDFEAVPAEQLRANLERAARKFDVMAELGVDTVLVCSSVSPAAVDDDALAAAQLGELADAAAARGIRIAYEALAWGRHVSTWDHSWRIVQRAGHPALGLCLDSFHVLSRPVPPDGIAAITPGKIFFVQLADAPELRMDVLQWSRHHRLFPGQGDFDLPGFVALTRAAGYDGPLSLEVFNDVFRQSDPSRTAVDAMRSLIALEPAGLPTAPTLGRHAFTEFTVDGQSGPELRTALRGLGFAHTGQHRTKPVELWEQNACRIVLNSAVIRPQAALLSAFAVTSDDPARSLARASALRAPAHPNVREPGEAALSAITAPDGTSVFVTRDDDDWRSDFLATGAVPQVTAGLTGTDHLGLTQPFDHFDEAGLFYRSVLGLTALATEEFAAPYGLMRSRAVASGDRGVRLALTVSVLRRGEWAPAVADPQHVAFGTADIFATAAALTVPTLPVPDNYYADLIARLGLPEEFAARLSRYGILYDRDAAGGELLHLYTPVLGGRVFFELVERRGGYDRFGEPNAPVRMAAHRHRRLTHR